MQTSRRPAGIALLVFTLGTFAALRIAPTPAGNYSLSQIHGYLAPGARATTFAGAVIGILAALALLYYLSALRAAMPSGRGRDLLWGSGIAAVATAAVGWMTDATIPLAYAQGGGHVSLTPSVVYTFANLSVAMVYGPGMLFAGIAVIIAARQLRTAPRWWRVLGYIGGSCAILSMAFFPFYLFVVYGVVVGAWGVLARGGRPVAAPQPETVNAI
jgi:hypothetical protein